MASRTASTFASLLALAALTLPAHAATFAVTVDGPDAIFLAGRTDVTIPEPNAPWTGPPGAFLLRHGGPTPEEAKEQFPDFISVLGGQIVRVLDPASGSVNFFNGTGDPRFGPSGNGSSGSNLTSLGGISGYLGPQGPLTGVFLGDGDSNTGPAPATLNFTTLGAGALGIDFETLSPLLGQVFYIGDGKTSADVFQQFVAPVGATRLFFGIPDGFGFGGAPGAYDDNDGSYRIVVGVDEIPQVPEPGTLALLALGLAGLGLMRRRRA